MNIAILSLPGSGTHLLRDSIFHMYEKSTIQSDLLGRDNVVFSHHWTDGWEAGIEATKRCFAIVPMRHPRVHLNYWREMSYGIDQAGLLELWEKLIDVPSVHFLPIDSPLRDYWLSNINRAAGLHLNTDWPVINKGTTGPMTDEIKQMKFSQKIEAFCLRYWGYV